MDTKAKESGIIQKTLDLCQAVVDQPDFQDLKQKLDTFLADEYLKFQFQQVNQLGELLQMKHSGGVEIGEEEIAQFETLRQEVMGNPAAIAFLEAQEQMQKLHQVVGRYLDRTFELGRRPEFDEMNDGSCGNCDCH
jgi:cell fate (sporulation/competence/biofilm development) regulator YlbF (YheA/YmcA/DUF963 family)